MSLDARHLRVLRRNLEQFIRDDPIEVTLTRTTKVLTANGGVKDGVTSSTSPQTFRLVPFKRRLSDFTTNTQDGAIPKTDFVLIARWDADIQRWDKFTYMDDNYIVVSIETKTKDRANSDRLVVEVATEAEGLAWQAASSF